MDKKWGLQNSSEPYRVKQCQQLFVSAPTDFFFYASDGDEPIHIHVLRDDNMAKFWVYPVRLAVNIGFPPKELREIEKLVELNKPEIERKWNEFFSHS